MNVKGVNVNLGWIDFSKSDRDKVLNVLDKLSEPTTLDELGIAPVRDGFANLFFPGTSSIQTRAKYFFLVPYALRSLEKKLAGMKQFKEALQLFDDIQKKCCDDLRNNGDDNKNIIGSRARKQGKWIMRTPADIYWAGLRSYGIISEKISLSEYIRYIWEFKNNLLNQKSQGYCNEPDNCDDESDDEDAVVGFKNNKLLIIPTYTSCCLDEDKISIKLNEDEQKFLTKQIIENHPQSLLAYILSNPNELTISSINDFKNLGIVLDSINYPGIQDILDAIQFSDFIFVLRTVYNMIISDNRNEVANKKWNDFSLHLDKYANLDLDRIFERLQIQNLKLKNFLQKTQNDMKEKSLEKLKKDICDREADIKHENAKTKRPGKYDCNVWYGGYELDYRYKTAKQIIIDILN